MKRSLLGLTATFVSVGSSHASVLVDDFESYGPPFANMDGKGSWTVINGDAANNLEGPVAIVSGPATSSPLATTNATVGGIEQTMLGITSLSNSSFSVPLVSLTPQPTFFLIDTAYLESAGGSSRDPFSFVLGSTVGDVLTINFTPGGSVGQYTAAWSVFGGDSGTAVLNQDYPTQFRLDTYASGSDVGYTFSSLSTQLGSGILTGASPTANLNSLSVNWDSTNSVFATGGTSNSFTIDNVNVVPEPSSALLGMLGASFAFFRRRRA